jgi:plasmid maintenance system antidote protein VapI
VRADLAVRLSDIFGISAEFLLNLQMDYDLWQAEERYQQSPDTILSLPETQKGAA